MMVDGSAPNAPVPGVVAVWSGDQPVTRAYRIPPGGVVLGRELLGQTRDDRISRQHARLERRDHRFAIADLGSRNGTYIGAHALVDREVTVTAPAIVRTGRTVFVVLDDIRPYENVQIEHRHDTIVGAITRPLWDAMEHAARRDVNLFVLGEPGTGKGRIARGYARLRGLREAVFNPTVQAIPLERVAGPRVETLILEQVGKLGAASTAALVNLVTRRPEVRIVTTAALPVEQLGLPPEVAARLATQRLYVPPLRERPDEMAYLIDDAVRGSEPGLQIHSTLIEACLLRPWPGNARELCAVVSQTAHTVAGQGKNNIRGEDLGNEAGHLMIGAPTLNAAVTPTTSEKRSSLRGLRTRDEECEE
jgi:hypothetical protein